MGRESCLRFGVIGCGRATRELHLPAWKAIPQARLIALCDTSVEALEGVVGADRGVRRYTDSARFLADSENLDFAVLATPVTSRVGVAEAIMERGIHLVCEKPLALDTKSALDLFAAAERNGVLLTPVHNYRFRENSIAALSRATRRTLGDVVSVSVKFRSGSLYEEKAAWMRQERLHKILLFDFGYHFVDLALLFLGPVASVRFVEAENDSMGIRYVAFGTLHENGARGLFELMLDASSFKTEIEVLGEERGLALEFFPNGFRLLPHRDTPLHRGLSDLGRLWSHSRNRLRGRVWGLPEQAVSHMRLFAAFVEALATGAPNPISKESVLGTISLLEHIAGRAYGKDIRGYPDELRAGDGLF